MALSYTALSHDGPCCDRKSERHLKLRKLSGSELLISQAQTREWAAQHRAQLDGLAPLAADTQALLAAAADTEAAPTAKVSSGLNAYSEAPVKIAGSLFQLLLGAACIRLLDMRCNFSCLAGF